MSDTRTQNNAANVLQRTIDPTEDDVRFWTERLTEHALFIYKLLNENVVPRYKQEAKEIYNQYVQELQKQRMTFNAHLSNELYALLGEIKTIAMNGSVINVDLNEKDFIALVKHMIYEQNYFVRLLNNRITVRDELIYWVQESHEHTELVSHLLPEGTLKKQAKELSSALKQLTKGDDYVQDFNYLVKAYYAAVDVYERIAKHEIPNIDPEMVAHEVREAERGCLRFRNILLSMGITV